MIAPTVIPILLYMIEWTLLMLHVVPLYLKTTRQTKPYQTHIRGGTRARLFFTEFLSVGSTLGYVYWRSNGLRNIDQVCSPLWLQLLVFHCLLHLGYTITTIVNKQGIIELASDVSIKFTSVMAYLFLVFDTSSHVISVLLLRSLIAKEMKNAMPVLSGVPAVSFLIYTIQSRRFYSNAVPAGPTVSETSKAK